MLNRETYILTKVLGEDDPQVRSILWASRSPAMQKAVPQLLRGLCIERGIDPDNPPPIGLPVRLSPSMYPVGRAKCGDLLGEPVGPSSEDLRGHVGVFGTTGAGKSSLVKLLLCRFVAGAPGQNHFVCLDLDGEYADLVAALPAGEAAVLQPEQLGVNPLEVPKLADGTRCTSPERWIGYVRELLRLSWLNEPTLNLLAEVLLQLYAERGVLDGGDNYPRLSDVIDVLERMSPPRSSDRARARDKLLDRLTAFRAMLPGLDVHASRDVHGLFWDHSAVLDLSGVADIALPLLFNVLVNVFTNAFRAEPGEPVSHMLVIEEAHALLGGQVSRRTGDLRENRGVAVLRSLRKCGFCGVVLNQLVAGLDPAVTGNLGSVICLRLVQKRCIIQAASMLGLEDWAQDELAALDRQEAIVRLSRHPHPIQLAIDDAGELALHAGDREAASDASRRVLDSLPSAVDPPDAADAPVGGPAPAGVGSPPPACAGGAGQIARDVQPPRKPACVACAGMGLTLKRNEHRVMQDICEEPASSIQERCDRSRMPREEESGRRRSLMKMWLMELAGSVGNKRLLFQPTAKGREWARAHGLNVPKYHASVLHEFIRRITEQRLAQAAPGTRFVHEGTGQPGGVRPDSVAMLPGSGGGRIVIQVVVGHGAKGEALNLLKLCEAEDGAGWVDLVLSVAAKRSVQQSVEGAVKELNAGQIPANLVFLDAECLMDPACDLTWVLERDV